MLASISRDMKPTCRTSPKTDFTDQSPRLGEAPATWIWKIDAPKVRPRAANRLVSTRPTPSTIGDGACRRSNATQPWPALMTTPRWDEQQLLEFPIAVGQYVCTALVLNAFCIHLGPETR